MKEIIYYRLQNGKCPFQEWYNSLDKSIRLIIDRRIDRLEQGNFGTYKQFDNLIELKFTQGAGYRIYTYEIKNMIIIFLCGGNKSSQSKDILLAKRYLQDFKERYQ